MADATKTEAAPVHPLKRLLRKASRSKTSVVATDEAEVATPEGRQPLERIASIAVTLPDDNNEILDQQQPVINEEALPSPTVPSKDAKRRASLVDKLKGLAGNKKDRKNGPTADGVVEQAEDTNGTTPSGLTAQAIPVPSAVRPIDIAKRVRDLLTSAPPFYPTTLVASETKPPPTSDSALGDLMGAKFLSTLSDHIAMSGSSSQESVWSILDRTKFSFQANVHGNFTTLAEAAEPDNSIMLCAPLFPDEDSQVELAEFQLVKVPLDELDEAILSAAGWWPPWEWGKKPKPSEPPTKVVRVWIPSTTKVSVQLAWWGYRIWLPPPVMKVLGDKSIEAVKRAAMIATALGWLVNHIPTAGLPVELVAVLTVAKALVPIIGYVGGFISWYWSTVQSFDKGQGVVLSATWLLPIALIPGNWDYTPPASDTPSGPGKPSETPATPTPAPSNPAPSNPTPPSVPNSPPIGTSPPPSMPSPGDGSPIVTIPGPGGIYQA